MGHKISKEQIDPGVKDHIMSFVGDVADLETEVNMDIISAVNSLMVDRVDNAENMGKLANAIGEPVTANHSVDEVVEGLGEMLSTFKTNMMNSGVMVESGDKFKSLIDKIKGLTEGEGNKGIQFAEGTVNFNSITTGNVNKVYMNLNFTPTYVIGVIDHFTVGQTGNSVNMVMGNFGTSGHQYAERAVINNVSSSEFDFTVQYGIEYTTSNVTVTWYAIGVGEEDTTLRDSLASILQEEGVSVTEEDDMASLINKVDEEFDRQVVPAGDATVNDVIAGKTFINSSGELLTGNATIESLGGTSIQKVFPGKYHGFILKSDGTLWGYGNNTKGELGIGSSSNYGETLMKVSSNINNDVKYISCGGNIWKGNANMYGFSFMIKTDGSLWSCGANNFGQLGKGSVDNYANSKFNQVTTNINNDVKQVACGDDYVFILKNDGSLWACGANDYGQLGLGDTTQRTSFTKVENISDINYINIITIDRPTTPSIVSVPIVVKNDGTVWSAGPYGSTFTQIL